MRRSPYHGHRFPPAIIRHAVWLYLRFTLSLRDIETCSQSGVSTSPTKPSGAGSPSSARCSPGSCGSGDPVRPVAGIWTRWSYGSRVSGIGSGGRWTTKVSARHPGSIAAGQGLSRQARAQADQEKGSRAGDHHHRQARVLRRRHAPAPSLSPPRPGAASEQPGREFAPADTSSGTEDAKVQVAGIGPALPVGPCGRPKTPSTPSATLSPAKP